MTSVAIKSTLQRVLSKRMYDNLRRVRRAVFYSRSLRRLRYLGAAFRCPICGSSVRYMRPCGYQFSVLRELDVIGGEYFENDVCPVCDAPGRARLIHRFLREKTSFLCAGSARDVLHFAPERGLALALAQVHGGRYRIADIAPERYPGLPVTAIDLTAICFPAESFDLVICNHVLEHVSDDRLAMREILRVLRPGGVAILQVPIAQKLETTFEDRSIHDDAGRERAYGQFDHVRLYGRDYASVLASQGFVVEILNPVLLWGEQEVSRDRINPREMIYVARRPGALAEGSAAN